VLTGVPVFDNFKKVLFPKLYFIILSLVFASVLSCLEKCLCIFSQGGCMGEPLCKYTRDHMNKHTA
jgi:hypothetical protein